MAHNHTVTDSDRRFKIHPATRRIINSSGKKKLMQLDHNSEVFTFEMPRFIDGHDMALCNVLEVHFNNISEDGNEQKPNMDELTIQVDPSNEENVIFAWTITENATQLAGILSFFFRFSCVNDDGSVEYNWHTESFDGITIGDVEYNSQVVIDFYADIIHTWRVEIVEAAVAGAAEAQTKAEEAQAKAEEAQVAAEGHANQSLKWSTEAANNVQLAKNEVANARTQADRAYDYLNRAANYASSAEAAYENASANAKAAYESRREAAASEQSAAESEAKAAAYAEKIEIYEEQAFAGGADWDAVAGEAGYIRGKPFGEDVVWAEVLPRSNVMQTDGTSYTLLTNYAKEDFVPGVIYRVMHNDRVYYCEAQTLNGSPSGAYLGDSRLIVYPFIIVQTFYEPTTETTYKGSGGWVEIHRKESVGVIQINPKYLPMDDIVAAMAEPHTLTEAQQTQARTNIGAITADEAVVAMAEPQTLTEEQKAQARANIGAAAPGEGGGTSVQSDWNQTDETAADYVKNRTHYKEATAFVEEQTFTPVADGALLTVVAMLSVGAQVTVVFDGEAYQCVTVDYMGVGVAAGNFALLGFTDDTGEPFFMAFMEQDGAVMAMCVCADNTTDHTVKVEGEAYRKLPTTYYDQAHKLYIDLSTNAYLAHDPFGNFKVTKEELISIAEREPIVLSLSDTYYYAPIVVHPYASETYGKVVYFDGDDIVTVYTAEYTPTT